VVSALFVGACTGVIGAAADDVSVSDSGEPIGMDAGQDSGVAAPRDAGGSSDASEESKDSGSTSGKDSGNAPDAAIPKDAGGSEEDAGQEDSGPAVTFTIDLTAGPDRQFQPPAQPTPISPYIYGVNAFAIWEKTTKWGLARQGGDAFTAWNWTNDYSNSGADYCFWEGNEGSSDLAGAITQGSFSIATAQSLGVAYLATAPIVDFVSATFSNNTGINNLCPGTCSTSGASSYSANSGNLAFVSTDPSSPAFVSNGPTKPGGNFCTCQPGTTCASACAVNDTGPVYQDEFANFLKLTYGSGASPIFLSLDNEPNYWASTHPELWPYTGTVGCGTGGTVTYDDIVTRDSEFATAIKAAWPQVKIFGPVVAQDGIIYAHSYSDTHLPTEFADYYLSQMASASSAAGHPLIDVFDVHYYSNSGSSSQCLQVPRLFWDPSFTEFSAATTDGLDFGWSGLNNYFDTDWYPRQVVPRLLGKIAMAYATSGSAAPGLSFSEYNPGCETQIEGGVAEADLLGVFGREGVFAATAWPLQAVTNNNGQLVNYLVAAYDLYRNYDGKGTVVGDTAVLATTSDIPDTSVYAFAHSTDANAIDLVVINKAANSLATSFVLAHAPSLATVAAYQLVGSAPAVVAASGPPPTIQCNAGSCTVRYTMPPLSATTITLRP
jgi:hypothetical protein